MRQQQHRSPNHGAGEHIEEQYRRNRVVPQRRLLGQFIQSQKQRRLKAECDPVHVGSLERTDVFCQQRPRCQRRSRNVMQKPSATPSADPIA